MGVFIAELVTLWRLTYVIPDTYNHSLIPLSICFVASSHVIEPVVQIFFYPKKSHRRKNDTDFADIQVLDFCMQFVVECVAIGMGVSLLLKQRDKMSYI